MSKSQIKSQAIEEKQAARLTGSEADVKINIFPLDQRKGTSAGTGEARPSYYVAGCLRKQPFGI